jgi:hypothetical protein
MRCFAAALLCLLPSGACAAKEAIGPVGPDAVWQPPAGFVESLHKTCDSAPKFGDCAAKLILERAPAPAAAFSRTIHYDGWLRDFREVGRVDIAYVDYPFHANENQGWVLVNGSPALVDVDDFKKLPQADMKSDPAWGRLVAQKPNATLFPGGRAGNLYPVALINPDGSEEFIVNYKIVDGCHACAVLGEAFFSFEFNQKGKFVYANYSGLAVAGTEGWNAGAPAWPVRSRSGQKFTLSLPGTDWAIEQPPADWIVRTAGLTEQGEQFEVAGAGITQMTLRRGSEHLILKFVSAPGLRRQN